MRYFKKNVGKTRGKRKRERERIRKDLGQELISYLKGINVVWTCI